MAYVIHPYSRVLSGRTLQAARGYRRRMLWHFKLNRAINQAEWLLGENSNWALHNGLGNYNVLRYFVDLR